MRTILFALIMSSLSVQATTAELLLLCNGYSYRDGAFQTKLIRQEGRTYLQSDLLSEDVLMRRVSLTTYLSEDGLVSLTKTDQGQLNFVLSIGGEDSPMSCILP